MRVSSWLLSAICIVGFALACPAQDPSVFINGPILGFVNDPGGATVQPILGVPGASVLGPALDLGAEVRNIVISPTQDFAIAVRGEDAEAVLIRFASDAVAVETLAGVRGGSDAISISPNGKAVGLFSSQIKSLQIVTRITETPQVLFECDLADIPGNVRGLAVSDDGMLALINFVNDNDETAIWLVSLSGYRWPLAAAHPSAAAFLPGRHDVIIADSAAQTVDLITDVDQASSRMTLAAFGDGFDSISAVAATADGLQVAVTTDSSDKVTIVDIGSGATSVVACNCRATGLHRLRGNGIFRLSESSSGAVSLIDFSGSEPRALVIPAPSPEAAPEPAPEAAPAAEGVELQ